MHELVIRDGNRGRWFGRSRPAPATSRSTATGSPRSAPRHRCTAPLPTIDADGLLVAPGFVDVHTHYDAQVTWDPLFVVVLARRHDGGDGQLRRRLRARRPDRQEWLIELMEGVEDIPGTALTEGIAWEWQSVPGVSRRARRTALRDRRRGRSARPCAST